MNGLTQCQSAGFSIRKSSPTTGNNKNFMENKTNEMKAKSLDLEKLINYQDGSVVSREILKLPAGTLTVFAFDAGQGLSEHTAPLTPPFIS